MTGGLDETALKIAQALSRFASKSRLVTYPMLASEVGWHLPSGQGLGQPLEKLLSFCKNNNLPIITTIVCKKGTGTPSDGGMERMRHHYGEFDLNSEQDKVFAFDWSSVSEFEIEKHDKELPSFDRLFATRVYGFGPDRWGMLGFGKEGFRNNAVELMDNKTGYVVHFCSFNDIKDDQGNSAIAASEIGRVLGIAEIKPTFVGPDTHIETNLREETIEQWGKDKWPYGLEMSRAWRFVKPPFTKNALPITSKSSWGPTNSIVAITKEERAALAQYELKEVPVFCQKQGFILARPRDPSNYTYLMMCDEAKVFKHTVAPLGSHLVKIGVTSDPERRLLEIGGNHLAVIFGLNFIKIADQIWPNQNRALEVEAVAHDWAHENCMHASGEYFFMTKEQYEKAAQIVMLGKIV